MPLQLQGLHPFPPFGTRFSASRGSTVARFSYLKTLSEGTDLGRALNEAMEAIETEDPDLQGVLPRDYARFDNSVLAELLRLIGSILEDI